MKDDLAIIKNEIHLAHSNEGYIVQLYCLAKAGTARWYYNSMTTLPFSTSEDIKLNLTLSNTGYYYCYGFDEYMFRYFLSQTKVQALCKFLERVNLYSMTQVLP